MWTISQLKSNAKVTLKACYWKVVLVAMITSLVSGAISISVGRGGEGSEAVASIAAIISALVSIFIVLPLGVGCFKFYLCAREQGPNTDIENILFPFKSNYGNIVKTMFLMELFTGLWTMLFIIPGIIKSYEYRMIPYLLAENPDLDYKEAFAKSREMMMGEKLNAFVLDLSFIGWIILSVFTLGILAIFYVSPYMELTNSELYLALKAKVAPVNMMGQPEDVSADDTFEV